ncbi:MAG: hypothetical protein MH252_09745 [Thermosynechococcaceae cyanobacterium MS004]|nr:hypothetical protein [Thermosynechococcaceae cyanobacterium MS004]
MKSKQIIGWFCIGLSLLMIIALPNRDLDTLTCDRTLQTCSVERLRWDGVKRVSIPVQELLQAEVQRRKKSGRVSYLLILRTERDELTVSYNGSVSRKESIATRVNSFIKNPQASSFSEKIEQTHWMRLILAAIIGGLGFKAVVNPQNKRKT